MIIEYNPKGEISIYSGLNQDVIKSAAEQLNWARKVARYLLVKGQLTETTRAELNLSIREAKVIGNRLKENLCVLCQDFESCEKRSELPRGIRKCFV